jgi:hypothetical protein
MKIRVYSGNNKTLKKNRFLKFISPLMSLQFVHEIRLKDVLVGHSIKFGKKTKQ